MPFIPHTDADVGAMLSVIGVDSIEQLFDEIPGAVRAAELAHVAPGVSEMQMLRDMSERAQRDAGFTCFMGAGSYDHHIPAAVWDITARGEFMTAYTPYQAEASQGTLQLIYEYQSMMTALTAMEVSNASVYDGASGLGEAVLMAIRANRKSRSRKVLMAQSVSPLYQTAAVGVVGPQGIGIDPLAFSGQTGSIDASSLPDAPGDYAALVIAQPNFFGRIEEVDQLTDWAHEHGMLVIAVVNPLTLTLLKPPGEWGATGADIACGDGQPLGIPMSSGGPSFGFMCTRQAFVRQMPGRIIGKTVDLEGRIGFALTLQAREQHIRRAKATSNICTNQGLLVTAGTIHMAIMGSQGLTECAAASHENTQALLARLTALEGVNTVFSGPTFHEAVVRVPGNAQAFIDAMVQRRILPGYALGEHFPEMSDCLLVCATEKRTAADIDAYVAAASAALQEAA